MVSVIKQYQGTIDEFIGDAIFVLFGAPIWQEDDAQRAVACGIAMQLAMASVNEQNRQDGLPVIEMGIGIHTGQVVVGNIGSAERTKYGVVGSQVNLTSRIQSCTTGGQTLISEATRREVGPILKLGRQMEVKAKGIEYPITVSEVLGIGRPHQLYLPDSAEDLVPLVEEVPLTYMVIESNQTGGDLCSGVLTKLSRKGAEARLESSVDIFSNLEMYFAGKEGESLQDTLYGKVVGSVSGTGSDFSICFQFRRRSRSSLANCWPKRTRLSRNRRYARRRSAVAPLCARTVETCRQALLFHRRISCDANYFATA
jgi:adenylate cyclase